MEKYLDKKLSRRSVLGGGLKAAVALGAAPGVVSLSRGALLGAAGGAVARKKHQQHG